MNVKGMKVWRVLMGFATVAVTAIGLCACNANDDNPARQEDYAKYEPYGLTYHNFDSPDDVRILNADTTEIAVKKSLADKLGITTFVNHPMGIWDAPSHLSYGRKAVDERLDGDYYVLKVTKVTVAELIGDRATQLSTDIYVKKNFRATGHDIGGKYTDEDGRIHPAVVHLTDPFGYDKRYHVEGEKPSEKLLEAAQKGEYEYMTAEELAEQQLGDTWKVRVISMHDKLEFEHQIPIDDDSKDSININGEIPIDFDLNYYLTFEPDWEWDWGIRIFVKRFETGLDGAFGFHPSINVGFKKELKLDEDKGKIKLASFSAFSFTFTVGIVPVTVVVSPSLYLMFDASVSGAVQLNFGYNYASTFKAGARYRDGKGWDTVSEYDVTENEFTFAKPQVAFHAEAGVGLFLTAAVKIYDVAGPELGLGPRLGTTADLVLSPDGADWSGKVDMTLQAWVGAKFEVLGYELAEWSKRFDIAGPWTILKFPE